MMRLGAARGAERERALTACAAAVRRGDLIVIPTEQVYGLATDAFHMGGTSALRELKGYATHVSLPVLVATSTMVSGIAQSTPLAEELIEAFWPGGLTLVLPPQPTLAWDASAGGPVAVRMPLHPFTLALVQRTGPLAVTSANPPGIDPPTTIDGALLCLGDHVTLAVDTGPCPEGGESSSIVDLTGPEPVLVREGAVSRAQLASLRPDLSWDA
jgi:tRNA threonylcarbamoyl adenosine modification protein (Sua5/YciO/YrdC/YwlC family)